MRITLDTTEENITILNVKAEDIIYNPMSYEFSDTVTVGLPYNNSTYSEGLPIADTGKTFLMFVYPTATKSSSMELPAYVDLWLSSPNHLFIEEINGYYIAGSFFSDYLDPSSNMTTQLGLTETEVDEYVSQFLNNENPIITESKSYVDDPPAILKIMSERMNPENNILWELMSNSFIVDKTMLEDIIKVTADKYYKAP